MSLASLLFLASHLCKCPCSLCPGRDVAVISAVFLLPLQLPTLLLLPLLIVCCWDPLHGIPAVVCVPAVAGFSTASDLSSVGRFPYCFWHIWYWCYCCVCWCCGPCFTGVPAVFGLPQLLLASLLLQASLLLLAPLLLGGILGAPDIVAGVPLLPALAGNPDGFRHPCCCFLIVYR